MLVFTFPDVASKLALLWPAGTVTLGGTESNGVLLAMTTTESEVAGAFNVTAHLPDLLLDIADGEQCTDFGCPFVAPCAVRVKV